MRAVSPAIGWGSGSPPHTRGHELGSHRLGQDPGITPAYAGTCIPGCAVRIRCRDHPRIRGDMTTFSSGSSQETGSPPHTRGHGSSWPRDAPEVRITPAYAGTCSRSGSSPVQQADHPRIRGDMSVKISKYSEPKGSPPHTRGHVIHMASSLSRNGITPAYAGTCQHSGFDSLRIQDHPRIRGDMPAHWGWCCQLSGSPPHTRGHESRSSPWTTSSRITPAYAGTCMDIWARVWRYTDHPRIRGDMFGHRHCTTGGLGSPPHTRGHVAAMKLSSQPVRITPAYAGTCQRLSGLSLSFRDHPRIRGDMKP